MTLTADACARQPSGESTASRARARLRTAAVIAGLVAVATVAASPPATATNGDFPSNATQLAASTYPGVQLIEVDFEAELSVPVPRLNNGAVERLQNRLARQLIVGTLDASEKAIVEALVQEISDDPLTYFKPTSQRRTTTASLSGFGTGWVVTPDGYIVTAAHVVEPDPAELEQEFARTALEQFAEEDARTLADEAAGSGANFTSSQLERLTEATLEFNSRYLELGDVEKAVSAQIGVAVAGFDKSRQGKPVEVVDVGEPYPGKDVAILKLDGVTNLPTLPAGKDSDVNEGETLFVAGYPAASTFFSGLSEDSEVQPSVTQGPLTAIRSNEAGTPIFQTQAPASPGNSGGPVLEDGGNVVGILVASAVDDKGVALEGQEFVVPISVITEKLDQNNIAPRESPVTAAYEEALANYYRKYYKRALPQFEHVRNLYGAHPYVGDFISDTQTAIDAGEDQTPLPIWVWLAVAATVMMLLAAGAGIALLLFLRSRRRRPAMTAPVPHAAFSGQPGGYPYQQPPTPPYPPPVGPPAPPGAGPYAPPPPAAPMPQYPPEAPPTQPPSGVPPP